jgi:transposase
MPPARKINEEEIAVLEALAPKIPGRREYRRLQCVLLRAKEGLNAEEIGKRLSLNPRTVEKIHERYFKEELKAFEKKRPGPKGPRLYPIEIAQSVLNELSEKAERGEILRVREIQDTLTEKTGTSSCKGTVYNLLKRLRWSKKQPRKKHPKGDKEAQTLFKKTP